MGFSKPQNTKRFSGTALRALFIGAFLAAILLPFSDKAFHMDDPMYIWAAKHILSDPVNFYGFNVNWFGIETPMPYAMKNPPLVSYYIAFVASIFGFGEKAIHTAMIVPAVAAGTGTFVLAKRLCSMPITAALICIVTPVFVISSSTVMCDTLMLALWIWAIILWMEGLDRDSHFLLLAAGLLIAMSALTKYFGISLIPLLTVYSVFRKKTPVLWVPAMILPVLVLAGYQIATETMYGRGLLFDAADYAGNLRGESGMQYLKNGLNGITFLGGCVITTVLYIPLIWSRRVLFIFLVLTIVAVILLWISKDAGTVVFASGAGSLDRHLAIEIPVFAAGGAGILALSVRDLIRRRDSGSVLIMLWLTGTFVFAGFMNWTTSGRAILPAAPVAGILIARAMEENRALEGGLRNYLRFFPLAAALLITLITAWADYGFADSARGAAEQIYSRHSGRGGVFWFQGHWGFQYYMESLGAKSVDWKRSSISRGEVIATPLTNTNVQSLPDSIFTRMEEVESTPSSRFSTVSAEAGAGFYSSNWGPVPYSIGPVFKDRYMVDSAKTDLDLKSFRE